MQANADQEAKRAAKRRYSAAYYRRNRDRLLAERSVWASENPGVMAANARRWRERNPGAALESQKDYLRRNPWRHSFSRAERVWRYIVPHRFSLDLDARREFYKNKPAGMVIDHIIPFKGKNVSGLHVSWNLQYLTPEENMKKGNRHGC